MRFAKEIVQEVKGYENPTLRPRPTAENCSLLIGARYGHRLILHLP